MKDINIGKSKPVCVMFKVTFYPLMKNERIAQSFMTWTNQIYLLLKKKNIRAAEKEIVAKFNEKKKQWTKLIGLLMTDPSVKPSLRGLGRREDTVSYEDSHDIHCIIKMPPLEKFQRNRLNRSRTNCLGM